MAPRTWLTQFFWSLPLSLFSWQFCSLELASFKTTCVSLSFVSQEFVRSMAHVSWVFIRPPVSSILSVFPVKTLKRFEELHMLLSHVFWQRNASIVCSFKVPRCHTENTCYARDEHYRHFLLFCSIHQTEGMRSCDFFLMRSMLPVRVLRYTRDKILNLPARCSRDFSSFSWFCTCTEIFKPRLSFNDNNGNSFANRATDSAKKYNFQCRGHLRTSFSQIHTPLL